MCDVCSAQASQDGPAFEVWAVRVAVERKEVVPGKSDVHTDVLAPADGVSDGAVMGGVLRLQLYADTNGEIGTHE